SLLTLPYSATMAPSTRHSTKTARTPKIGSVVRFHKSVASRSGAASQSTRTKKRRNASMTRRTHKQKMGTKSM
ncbi:hypothetical protein PENTCL1PPCAC_17382, partial [Pristionchus entomophagus]